MWGKEGRSAISQKGWATDLWAKQRNIDTEASCPCGLVMRLPHGVAPTTGAAKGAWPAREECGAEVGLPTCP